MKRSLLFFLFSATAIFVQSSPADVLYDRSNIITGIGNGFNGSNTSAIATGANAFGFNQNGIGMTFSLADRFVLGMDSMIASVAFNSYSTSNYPFPPPSPFTAATLNIWNAEPGTPGAVVLFTSNTLSMTAWTGVYRVTQTTLTNAQRPVMTLSMAFPNVSLVAGTYWASWTVTGIVPPGQAASVFSPPVMNSDGTLPTGTSVQSTDGGVTWAPTTDSASGIHVSVPLTINGTVIPEPSTTALIFVSGAALAIAAIRSRRRV